MELNKLRGRVSMLVPGMSLLGSQEPISSHFSHPFISHIGSIFFFFSRAILEGPWLFQMTEISGIFLELLVGESTVEKKTSPEFTPEWLIIGTGLNLKLTSNATATPYPNWGVTHSLWQIVLTVHCLEHGHLVQNANEHRVVTFLHQKGTRLSSHHWKVSTNHDHKRCSLIPAHLCLPASYFFNLQSSGGWTNTNWAATRCFSPDPSLVPP